MLQPPPISRHPMVCFSLTFSILNLPLLTGTKEAAAGLGLNSDALMLNLNPDFFAAPVESLDVCLVVLVAVFGGVSCCWGGELLDCDKVGDFFPFAKRGNKSGGMGTSSLKDWWNLTSSAKRSLCSFLCNAWRFALSLSFSIRANWRNVLAISDSIRFGACCLSLVDFYDFKRDVGKIEDSHWYILPFLPLTCCLW